MFAGYLTISTHFCWEENCLIHPAPHNNEWQGAHLVHFWWCCFKTTLHSTKGKCLVWKEYKLNRKGPCSLTDGFQVQILAEKQWAQLQINTYYTHLQHYGMFSESWVCRQLISNMPRNRASTEVCAEALGAASLNRTKQLFTSAGRYLGHSNASSTTKFLEFQSNKTK